MIVLVTGGSGFLGRFVIPKLIAAGADVVALARSRRAMSVVEQLGAKPIGGDLDDPASIDAAFTQSGAERLVNLASLGFGHAPTIVAAAEEAGLDRAVFVSTTAIFTSLPAASKEVRTAAEGTIRHSALRWTIVRPTMIYGAPGDRNMERLLRLLRRVPLIPAPGGGKQVQQPVHVDDLASAIVNLTFQDGAHRLEVDLPGPEPLSFKEVIHQAGMAVGRNARVLPIPFRPTLAALRGYERISRRPRLKAEQLERLVEDKAFDVEPARRTIGFAPRSFAVGIREEARALGLAPVSAS